MTAPSSSPRNASAALSTVLLDALVEGGVGHAVLSPGSRSAPLAFALEAAAVQGRIRLHTRIDERSAGFLALGIAVTTRSPVLVVTTSGTAPAHLHPAVLEASERGVPLVVLSADRPARLRGTQANQTSEHQPGLFASAVRAALDVPAGDPTGDQAAQRASWTAVAADVLASARGEVGGDPGPVHLNLQLDGPLVPGTSDGWTYPPTPVGSRPDGSPGADHGVGRDMGRGAGWERRTGSAALERGPRTVVVAGEDAGPPARILAQKGGWPLLAEPTSGSRTGANAIRTYRLLLADPTLRGRIERVVVCGHPTLSRPVTSLIGDPTLEVLAVRNRTGWTDPARVARRVESIPDVEGEAAVDDRAWLAEWTARDAEVGTALDRFLAGRPELTPYAVAGAVARSLPPNGLLFVGASNPVRDLDLMVPRYPVGDRRLVVGNRGLAGIDGSVSTAIGAALGRQRTSRAFALLGDVTFLHDANGLLLGPSEERPDLTIVVVNDDGGSIFASLEQGGEEYAGSYERLFGTPHHVDLAALCAATRTPHWRVESLPELEHALASPGGGIEVVEATVSRADRRALGAQIADLV